MKTKFILFVISLFSCVAISSTVIVPLPGAAGPISTSGKTITFDSGTDFKSISQVNLHCSGTITYGLGCGDGVERPSFPNFDWPAVVGAYMDPPGLGIWTSSFGSGEGPFNQEKTFDDIIPATWDFLLDGQAEIKIYVSPNIILGGVMLVPPSGTINEAHLTVLGTIIDIMNPASGQYLSSGSISKIEWQDYRSLPNCNGNYLLEYSIDGGGSWAQIGESTIVGSCSYDWLVPDANSGQCRIRITDINDPNISDSSGQFTIYQCQRTLDGDLNNDCYVNFRDYAILAQNWCACGNPYDSNCQ